MHDGARHAGAHGVIEEHGVQHGAGGRVEAEADVGQAEDDLDVRKALADHLDPVQRPHGQLAVVLVACRHRECQWIDEQVTLREAEFAAGEIDQPLGDLQLVIRGLGHAGLVDGQRDHGGAEFFRQLEPVFGGAFAVLEIDRVDDRLAAMQLQRGFDHRRLGAVDHQGHVHGVGETSDHLVHFIFFVAPHEGGAHVQRV